MTNWVGAYSYPLKIKELCLEIVWTGLGLILKTESKKSALEIIYQIAFLYRMVYHKGVFWAPCFSRFILMTCQLQQMF